MRKQKILWLYVLIFAIVLTGCGYKSWLGNRPCDQPNTTWVSEDRSVCIEIDKNMQGTGYIQTGDDRVAFIYVSSAATIELYHIEAEDRIGLYPEEMYERWVGTFDNPTQFTVTVEETTFFDVGEKIIFYREND